MESTELQLYTLPKSTKELETAFISEDFTDKLIESIREKAKSVVGDISTAKGRKAYISMAATVRSSKVAIDEAGKTLVAEMKKRPALVDASRRKIREALDDLAIEIREPVTQWEAEQERIKAEEKFNTDHLEALEMNAAFDKALSERIEADHEIALLMNEKLDRDREEQARLAEAQRKKDEETRRANDIAHKKSVNQAALKALVKEGLPEDCAKQCITAIALNKIPNLTIKY
jgi:colicin import membrane protein